MLTWLKRLFVGRSRRLGRPRAALPSESSPSWEAALLDAIQKSSRAQVRLSVHVEELERKLVGGLAEMRGLFPPLRSGPPGHSSGHEPAWSEFLDALDLLEEASGVARAETLASGLEGISARLERFLSSAGITRVKSLGHVPDGRLFRIVGTQPHPRFAEGTVARVVRAAALRGECLLREGQALIVRNTP